MRGDEDVAVDESVHVETATDQYPGFIAIDAWER